MNDSEKTKEQLISELEELRQWIHEPKPVEAEQALKEREARLRRAQQVANMGFWNGTLSPMR